ncbi:tetratricopeptide repeat protein [Verrucomicrobium spinosum]|uniref:tetratricopeptide repeat protein n=1 Tax=Verrucomicrobium spinosum TaxID=2736 RepID=UPI0009463C0F|nr:tetratricopeptide repeat protein [Verrucomicrobium spinosum]
MRLELESTKKEKFQSQEMAKLSASKAATEKKLESDLIKMEIDLAAARRMAQQADELKKQLADKEALYKQLQQELAETKLEDSIRSDDFRMQLAEKDASQRKLEAALAAATKDAPKAEDLRRLMAENQRLKEQLEEASLHVANLKDEGMRKDAEISALKTQITSIQGELVRLRQENTVYQTQVADLTVKLKELSRELDKQPKTQVAGTVSPGESARLSQENEMLRNIIMRQLRQQERQRQAKEIVIGEMKKLENSSIALMQNLEEMTAGKIMVTVEEEPLFSEPQLKEIFAASGVNVTLETTSGRSPASAGAVAAPRRVLAYDASEEERLMAHAEEVLIRADYAGAAVAYQDVLRANPKNITALTSLAGIRLQEGKYEEAEVMLQKCLVYDPENPVAFYRLGVSYFQQSRMDEAYAMFAKSVEKSNDNARSRHYMASSPPKWATVRRRRQSSKERSPSIPATGMLTSISRSSMPPPILQLGFGQTAL